MSVSTAAMTSSTKAIDSSTSGYNTPFLGTFVAHEWSPVRRLLHHHVADLRLSAAGRRVTDALVAFYNGDRTRILIAAAFSGLNLLNLLWFAAALRTTLADAGQDGWGAAATASSAAFGALSLLQIAVGAAVAYSIAGSGNHTLTSGLNDFSWALVVLIRSRARC